MSLKINPYINFKDNAREAMDFYTAIFGGQLDVSTFGESGMPSDPTESDKIMHSELKSENGINFMAADTPAGMTYNPGTNMSLSLSGDDATELTAYFEKLSAGGTVTQPLFKAPWGDTFGMLVDKFGIQWLVNITGQVATPQA